VGELPAPFSAIGEISGTGVRTAVFRKMGEGKVVVEIGFNLIFGT